MDERKKFLLGNGERLTHTIRVSRSGRIKNPPYSLSMAKQRIGRQLAQARQYVDDLPDTACPDDKVVGSMTMHPRYVSKSDFPADLCRSAGLDAIGGKSSYVVPDEWGVDSHPEGAVADTWFVSMTRQALLAWQDSLQDGLSHWDERRPATLQLQSLERFSVPMPLEKIKPPSDGASSNLYEVVLHNERSARILEAFNAYAASINANPLRKRVRAVGGLVFLPVELESGQLEDLSKFSFVRAVRPMPALRTFRPPTLRGDHVPIPELPNGPAVDKETPVAIFDGGLPEDSPLCAWVNRLEPPGIGDPIEDAMAHGEQVTSAILFGHVASDAMLHPPFARIDHVRVIDEKTGNGHGLELYDVLDRILEHLDAAEDKYRFVNLSLGPDIPMDDDDIHRWTAELDARAASGETLFSVAVGNSGKRDAAAGLNRIQPPSDGVNLLAVGACDSLDTEWKRCAYSSVGPGRTPGVAKPDGVAFGGVFERPFGVIDSIYKAGLSGTVGTSFAAPLALRTALGVNASVGRAISPLGIRALFIHHAARGEHDPAEVGWGRFQSDVMSVIECQEAEVTVIYEGTLPLKEYLRTPIALPEEPINGMVDITATLVIAPEVDAAFAHAYTRGGLQVVFRPNDGRRQSSKPGAHAQSEEFFSTKNLYKAAEYELRRDGHKWEPCWKASKRKRGSILLRPCFDVYYHTRDQGRADDEPEPIPYVLVITVQALRMPDIYERTLAAYSDVLVPLEPQVEISTQV